jgi:hypothetical protein
MAVAGLIVALAACGGGGSKGGQTKTPTTKTPGVIGTITPQTTATAGETGAPAATAQDGADATPASDGNGALPTALTGERTDYDVEFTVASDPGNLEQLIEDQDDLPRNLTVFIDAGSITLNGDSPFIIVTGAIDANGAVTATGTGLIRPYRNVEATFQGTIANFQLTGTYAIGSNGALPGGQAITYNVTGTAPTPQADTPEAP